jgi:hypothetical protein
MTAETRQQRRQRERREKKTTPNQAEQQHHAAPAAIEWSELQADGWEQNPDDPNEIILKDENGVASMGMTIDFLNIKNLPQHPLDSIDTKDRFN